jgi:uncharacterized protein (DUF924 family)
MTSPASAKTVTFSTPERALAVLRFWFGDDWPCDWPASARDELWFRGGAAVDDRIRTLFASDVTLALDGALADWESAPHARLALVLLLDQFTRNIHRGQAAAFAGDARAQALVIEALREGMDARLPVAGRLFLYMPLMHAEDLALQEDCVACFTRLHQGAPAHLQETLSGNLRYAILHRDIVARFGRFPHRNAALQRQSTPDEIEFLKDGPRFGQ